MLKTSIIILIALLGLSCQRKDPNLNLYKIQGLAQGTYYAITYYHESEVVTKAHIDSLLEAFNYSLSVFNPNSIISRVNRNEEVVIDDWFRDVFQRSRTIAEQSGGAFDFSVGPLVNAWGFGFTERLDMNASIVDSLMQYVGYRYFRLEGNRVVKKHPNSKIDFNAIAQGYAVDVMADYLTSKGIRYLLVDLGGEVLARNTKPNGEKWRVGIEKPAASPDDARQLKAIAAITNKAIATSGNYRRFYVVDNQRFSHTISPTTGFPVNHSLLSASVMANNCMTADAWATAFMVMGLEESIRMVEKQPELDAFFIYSSPDGQFKTWASDGFKSVIVHIIEE